MRGGGVGRPNAPTNGYVERTDTALRTAAPGKANLLFFFFTFRKSPISRLLPHIGRRDRHADYRSSYRDDFRSRRPSSQKFTAAFASRRRGAPRSAPRSRAERDRRRRRRRRVPNARSPAIPTKLILYCRYLNAP